MAKELFEFSIVLLANSHNPTILNPDFLEKTNIIEHDWNWQVIGQPITTPAVSSVHYSSNVLVTVDPTKFQITDRSGEQIDGNQIATIASNYVRALPHIPYTAMGINFTTAVHIEDIDAFLTARFLTAGSWNEGDNSLTGIGFRFSYPLESGRIVFSLDKGIMGDQNEKVLICRGNFHRDLRPVPLHPPGELIIETLSRLQTDWDRFEQLHTAIIGE